MDWRAAAAELALADADADPLAALGLRADLQGRITGLDPDPELLRSPQAREAVRLHVLHRLMHPDREGMVLYEAGAGSLLLTPGWQAAPGLVLIVQDETSAAIGVWSVQLSLVDGLRAGAVLEAVRSARKLGFAVGVLHPEWRLRPCAGTGAGAGRARLMTAVDDECSEADVMAVAFPPAPPVGSPGSPAGSGDDPPPPAASPARDRELTEGEVLGTMGGQAGVSSPGEAGGAGDQDPEDQNNDPHDDPDDEIGAPAVDAAWANFITKSRAQFNVHLIALGSACNLARACLRRCPGALRRVRSLSLFESRLRQFELAAELDALCGALRRHGRETAEGGRAAAVGALGASLGGDDGGLRSLLKAARRCGLVTFGSLRADAEVLLRPEAAQPRPAAVVQPCRLPPGGRAETVAEFCAAHAVNWLSSAELPRGAVDLRRSNRVGMVCLSVGDAAAADGSGGGAMLPRTADFAVCAAMRWIAARCVVRRGSVDQTAQLAAGLEPGDGARARVSTASCAVEFADHEAERHGLTGAEGMLDASAWIDHTPRTDEELLAACQWGAVTLHLYDYSTAGAVRGFNTLSRLLGVGGAFHAGVEIYGQEYCFTADDGVVTHPPTTNDAHQYREPVRMGDTDLSPAEVLRIVHDLRGAYPAAAYDLLRNNCCTFADALCTRLGVGKIPRWVNRLAL